MKRRTLLASLLSAPVAGAIARSQSPSAGSAAPWKLTPESEPLVTDAKLRAQILKALDAAKFSGTYTPISHFLVRAATVVEVDGVEQVVLGGNTEYDIPEGIHGESSMLNHVIARFGSDVARKNVRFVAFYNHKCGGSGSCGDCRDYQVAVTDYDRLLIVCGQEIDHTVQVTRFRDQLVPESEFPDVESAKIPLAKDELESLTAAAQQAREGGVTLFTTSRHTGAAGISFSGRTYRAAGADDAAFHYRYPIGGLLQQAATDRDYFFRAIVVAGEKGNWPVVNYRDRQYGFEAGTFNQKVGKPVISLILTDGQGNYKMTTFADCLPRAFSTMQFMPQAVTNFLNTHEKQS